MADQMELDIADGAVVGPTPLASLVVLGYNQSAFIREAIEGAFAQDHDNLEIILSDDCSTDDTFRIMEEAASSYRGPHKVILNRNEANLGITGHINRIFEIAKGEMIVANAGDDISRPDRTRELHKVFLAENPLLIYSDVMQIDENGAELGEWSFHDRTGTRGPLKAATAAALALGAACAWHADLYRVFGKIEFERAYEDLVFSYRAILARRLSYVPMPLVRYRQGGVSHWKRVGRAEKLARQRARRHVQLAVCRQRLEDTRRFAPGRGRIIRTLQGEIAKLEKLIEEVGEAHS